MKPFFVGSVDLTNVRPCPTNRALIESHVTALEVAMDEAVLDLQNPIVLAAQVSIDVFQICLIMFYI